jgi:hypothetical protein
MKKHRHATSVLIDADRWREYFWQRRITLVGASEMIGRSSAWASVVANRGTASYWALDEIATELEVHIDELIAAVGTDAELERLNVCA